MDHALDIDLYQARMLVAFYKAGMQNVTGTMEAFVRDMPPNRNFLVVCGVERILEYLRELAITDKQIRIFKEVLPEIKFDDQLCNYLTGLKFSTQLSIRTMIDGDIAFAKEPLVSISGPIGLAQYVEKKVLSILNHDVRIASKAARISIAANGRPVSEFGGRRGSDLMAPEAARAAFIAGFKSTSNVAAYEKYGIPCIGTMGHVWVMSHLDGENDCGEDRAYNNWSKIFEKSIYLPDTYNTLDGVLKVMHNARGNIGGIRLDSGNLVNYSFDIRRRLNNVDAHSATIGATNDLDEYEIKAMLDKGCPIDWFGCGTRVVSTPDAPTCSFIYKLVEVNDPNYGHEFVAKVASLGKETLPGPKQVHRCYDKHLNQYTNDILDIHSGSQLENTESKLVERNISGWNSSLWPAKDARDHFIKTINKMPAYIKSIDNEPIIKYPVDYSEPLRLAISKFSLKHHGL